MSTPTSPDISVIIVNWNSANYLRKCLETIYRVPGDLLFEVVVIDNASYDGCDGMLADRYPQVKFIQSPVNLGFAGANNLAYNHSRGKTLLFLNPDTEIVGQSLQTMQRLLWEDLGAGALGCTLLNADGTLQTSCIQSFPTILNQLLDADALRRRFPQLSFWGTRPLLEHSDIPVPVEVVSGACLMVKRHVFESAGRFSTDYFMYAEDTDLCCKIRAAGFVVQYTDQATVIHHGGGSSKQRELNYFSAVVMRESLFIFLTKFRGRLYGSFYRLTTGCVALLRVAFLISFLAVVPGKSSRAALGVSLGKWVRILRWSLGHEKWARRLTHEIPALPEGIQYVR